MSSRYQVAVVALVGALAALALLGCAENPRSSGKAALSERERDSLLAESALPGARVVGRALQVSRQASARAADIDSLTR
jgi:hypothetical protein